MLALAQLSLILTLGICTSLVVKLWPYRRSFLHRILCLNLFGYVIWTVLLLSIFSTDQIENRILLTRCRQLIIPWLSSNWVIVSVLVFYPQSWSRFKKWAPLLYVVPAFTVFAAASAILNFSYAKEWVFYNFSEIPNGHGFLTYTFGPVVSFFFLYARACLIALHGIYLMNIFFGKGVRHKYAIYFFIGSLFYIGTEIYARYVLQNMLMMQLSVAAFWPTAVFFYLAVTRLEFLDIKALAQEKVFRHLPNPVVTVNPNGDLWDFNIAAEKKLGLATADIGRPADNDVLNKLLHGAESIELDGRTYQVYHHRIDVKGGEERASLYVLNDVHYITELNRDLAESNTTLRDLNIEIMRMTEFNRKVQTVLSHDMTGALSAVSTLLHGTRQMAMDSSQMELAERLDKMQQVSSAAIFLLRNILAWSQQEDQSQEQNLEECLDSVLLQLSPQIMSKKISVIRSTSTPGLNVQSSRFVIEAIFRNLLSNAIRYSPEESAIVIDVTSADNRASISITDKGVGIDENLIASILSRQKQQRAGEDGFGLGLSFTLGFIEGLKGEIEINSALGRGTKICVSFPLTS